MRHPVGFKTDVVLTAKIGPVPAIAGRNLQGAENVGAFVYLAAFITVEKYHQLVFPASRAALFHAVTQAYRGPPRHRLATGIMQCGEHLVYVCSFLRTVDVVAEAGHRDHHQNGQYREGDKQFH